MTRAFLRFGLILAGGLVISFTPNQKRTDEPSSPLRHSDLSVPNVGNCFFEQEITLFPTTLAGISHDAQEPF